MQLLYIAPSDTCARSSEGSRKRAERGFGSHLLVLHRRSSMHRPNHPNRKNRIACLSKSDSVHTAPTILLIARGSRGKIIVILHYKGSCIAWRMQKECIAWRVQTTAYTLVSRILIRLASPAIFIFPRVPIASFQIDALA